MISRLRSFGLSAAGALSRSSEMLSIASELKSGDLALFGELCVGGYEFLGESFERELIKKLQSSLAPGAFLGFTHFSRGFNELILLSSQKIEFLQKKHKLFTPNGEEKIFKPGPKSQIKVRDVAGAKIGALICFELRFYELWARLRGAEIILVPALWGAGRGRDFEVLCHALALQNRSFVISCSDRDFKFTKVFSPDGKSAVSQAFEPKKIFEFKTSLGMRHG